MGLGLSCPVAHSLAVTVVDQTLGHPHKVRKKTKSLLIREYTQIHANKNVYPRKTLRTQIKFLRFELYHRTGKGTGLNRAILAHTNLSVFLRRLRSSRTIYPVLFFIFAFIRVHLRTYAFIFSIVFIILWGYLRIKPLFCGSGFF